MNQSYNATYSLQPNDDISQVYLIGRIILMIMFSSNIIGNISVLVVMWGTGRKRRMRFFILNLAITDTFVAIGGILPELIWNLTVNFYAPDAICRLVKYMSTTATYASSFALALLSFDRAEAVINPFRSAKQTCCGVIRPRYLAISGWAAACICGIPGLLLAHLVVLPNGQTCYLDFSYISPKVYLTSVAVTVFIFPACFITICHVLMVVKIWQAASINNRESGSLGVQKNLFSRKICTIDAGEDSVGISKRVTIDESTNEEVTRPTGCIPRARIKTVKMTLVIVSVYIICWCPYMIWNLLVTFGVLGKGTPNFMKISPLIQHLVTLNSSANPIIFWIFSAHTILNERRKIRRSKVVQRHHRRWSGSWKNNIDS